MNAPVGLAYGEIENPSFVRGLCIALEHRWKPGRLFVIFTSYFDEADSHGGANSLTMGAFLGSAKEWELFGRRLRGLQKDYGFKIFHATEFKHKNGEFRGWSDEKCSRLVNDLTVAVRDELTEGIVISLSREQYLTQYKNLPFPKKMQPDSQWGLCFRACMAQIAQTVASLKGTHKIRAVVEEGHPNAGASKVIFKDQKKALEDNGRALYDSVTIAAKKDCEPLMVADFLAHTFKMFDDNRRLAGKGYADLTDAQPRKRDAGLTLLHFPPTTLQGLKDEFERKHKERQENHLKRREAWLASQKKDEP